MNLQVVWLAIDNKADLSEVRYALQYFIALNPEREFMGFFNRGYGTRAFVKLRVPMYYGYLPYNFEGLDIAFDVLQLMPAMFHYCHTTPSNLSIVSFNL